LERADRPLPRAPVDQTAQQGQPQPNWPYAVRAPQAGERKTQPGLLRACSVPSRARHQPVRRAPEGPAPLRSAGLEAVRLQPGQALASPAQSRSRYPLAVMQVPRAPPPRCSFGEPRKGPGPCPAPPTPPWCHQAQRATASPGCSLAQGHPAQAGRGRLARPAGLRSCPAQPVRHPRPWTWARCLANRKRQVLPAVPDRRRMADRGRGRTSSTAAQQGPWLLEPADHPPPAAAAAKGDRLPGTAARAVPGVEVLSHYPPDPRRPAWSPCVLVVGAWVDPSSPRKRRARHPALGW
jgi:hypothetical protein